MSHVIVCLFQVPNKAHTHKVWSLYLYIMNKNPKKVIQESFVHYDLPKSRVYKTYKGIHV